VFLASVRLLSVVCALLGAQTTPSKPAVKPFQDVPPTHWAYQAVTELHERGILLGYPPTKGDTTPIKKAR
jgi:hypothetical protein